MSHAVDYGIWPRMPAGAAEVPIAVICVLATPTVTFPRAVDFGRPPKNGPMDQLASPVFRLTSALTGAPSSGWKLAREVMPVMIRTSPLTLPSQSHTEKLWITVWTSGAANALRPVPLRALRG